MRMNSTRRAVLATLPLLTSLPAEAQSPTRQRVGDVTSVRGTALAHFGVAPPRRLDPQAPVLIEDMLATDPDARLACRLLSGLELRLGGNATLRVDSLSLRGPRPGVALSSLSGPLLIDRPPAPRAPPIALDLPWARIGVRGTRFFAGPLDEVFAVFVARGRVEVALPSGSGVVLTEGEGVDVPRQGAVAPLEVRRWGQARIARALALVE
jgi:ferric-dicitrate binding protein FerR (iron transport regulator)